MSLPDEVSYLVRSLLQIRSEVAQLEEQMAADFKEHPDAEILLSQPGLGIVLGARVLGESGDDPTRYVNASGAQELLRQCAHHQTLRQIEDGEPADRSQPDPGRCHLPVGHFSPRCSPGARRNYDQLIARGKTSHEALHALANRLVGILHGCLRRHCQYDDSIAWPEGLAEAA